MISSNAELESFELEPPPFVVTSPFDDSSNPRLGFVLRSCDGADFLVNDYFLSLASPVFMGMFEIPQPPTDAKNSGADEMPRSIIDVSETAQILDHLLRLIYPIDDPVVSLADTFKVLDAAIKYEMRNVIVSRLKQSLMSFAQSEPLRTCALASIWKIQDVLAAAATTYYRQVSTSRVNEQLDSHSSFETTIESRNFVHEMSQVSAGSYLRLITYLRTNNLENLEIPVPVSPSPDANERPVTQIERNTLHRWVVPGGADIIVRSYDGRDLRAHRTILSLSSLNWKTQLDRMRSTHTEIHDDGLPILRLPESGETIAILLKAVYPGRGSELDAIDGLEWGSLSSLASAATKYKLSDAIRLARGSLGRRVRKEPIDVFWLASLMEWTDEARTAAIQIAGCRLEEKYHPRMEDIETRFYFPLLKFCHSFRAMLLVGAQQNGILRYSKHYSGSGEWENAAWLWSEPTLENLSALSMAVILHSSSHSHDSNSGYNYSRDHHGPPKDYNLAAKTLYESMTRQLATVQLTLDGSMLPNP